MLKKLKQVTLGSLKTVGAFSLMQDSKWRRGRLLILAYHGLSLKDEHEWDPDLYMSPDYFYSRLKMLKKFGCNVLPLEEALQRLYAHDLPEHCVALTFDDGYYNFYKLAHPMLKEFNFPVTLYLATSYVHRNQPMIHTMYSYLLWRGRKERLNLRALTGQEGEFVLADGAARALVQQRLMAFVRRENLSADEQNALAGKLAQHLKIDYEALCSRRKLHLLTAAEVQQLAAEGVDIQLHTHHHDLPLNYELFNREIEDNRTSIQEMTKQNATHFCYPNGLFSREFLPWLERLGIQSATTCEPGFATPQTDRLLLPRLVDHTVLSPIEFEGWLTGVSASLPRRHHIYNPPLTVPGKEERIEAR